MELKQKRNNLLREIKLKLKEQREKKIDDVVAEVERSHDASQMFSAVKQINSKKNTN